jgi:2-haloalkanoic acid dehalogenase type II
VTARPLGDYQVLSFDCYGTLIDWETGIWEALLPLRDRNPRIALDRHSTLAGFAELESAQEREAPGLRYPDILARVHHDLARGLGLETDEQLDAAFGSSVPEWPAFHDSAPALATLATSYRLVILSNVHRDGFAASNRRLGTTFAAVYTAEDIGSYKPDPRNFEYLIEHLRSELGVEPEQVLHVAQSLFHDHVPAQAFGLATAWIDRQRLSQGGDWGATTRVELPPNPDFTFFSMAELAAAAVSPGDS